MYNTFMSHAFWITGLPGTGKSTVSDALKNMRGNPEILSMDEMRNIVTPHASYTVQERDLLYRALVYTARKVSDCGRDVIIDATGHRRKWRELARDLLPQFHEIYIRCPVDVCINREQMRQDRHHAPADIYRKADRGAPVPGVNVEYEIPEDPDIIIDTQTEGPEHAAARIAALIKK